MTRRYVAVLLCLLLLPSSALAVPALLPLIPLVVALAAKGAALAGSFVFLVLSFVKKNRRLSYLLLGLALLVVFVLLVVYFEHG